MRKHFYTETHDNSGSSYGHKYGNEKRENLNRTTFNGR